MAPAGRSFYRLAFLLVGSIIALSTLFVSDVMSRSYTLSRDDLSSVKDKIDRLYDDMNFIDSAFKDTAAGKSPPVRTAGWSQVVNDFDALAEGIKAWKFVEAAKRSDLGDDSPEAQLDCARYLDVLKILQQWHDNWVDTENNLEVVISALPELDAMSSRLDDAAKQADYLMKKYAAFALSPDDEIAHFFAWSSYDLIMVAKAASGAKAEADEKIRHINIFVKNVPQHVAKTKADLEWYQNRVPAMQEYCANK
jgi:hypothetical protein